MGSATVGWFGLRSLFDLAMSLVASAEEVKSMVAFADCGAGGGAGFGAGCLARATAAARVRARPMTIVERITPPDVLRQLLAHRTLLAARRQWVWREGRQYDTKSTSRTWRCKKPRMRGKQGAATDTHCGALGYKRCGDYLLSVSSGTSGST